VRDASVVLVTLSGELDIFAQPGVREALEPACDPRRDAMVDLSGVTYIEATTLGELVRVLREKNLQHRKLALVITTTRVARVFQLTGLDRTFAIHGSLAAAASALRAAS
jgi:anti-sigma B factor antagonist